MYDSMFYDIVGLIIAIGLAISLVAGIISQF